MPHFVGFQGPLGHGKTLNASLLALIWSYASENTKVFSNFELKGSIPFDHYSKWFEVAESLGSVIVWDEAQLQFDRRFWSRNTIASQILNMTRKLRAVHIFVTPVINTLDSRILDLIEVLVTVRKREGYGLFLDFYEYQDKRYGNYGRHIKTKFMPWKAFKRVTRLNLYDTYQMVYPFQEPRTEREQIAFLKELQDRHRLALERERKGITLTEVKEDDWYTTSSLKRDREREQEELKSEESSLLISEYAIGEIS